MNGELLVVALLAGAANWAFRVLPTLTRTDRLPPSGRLERFLSATGPAAIATLFVAAILEVGAVLLRRRPAWPAGQASLWIGAKWCWVVEAMA